MSRSTLLASPASLRALVFSLLSALLLQATGCAFGEFRPGDPFDRQLTFDEAQHRYTTLVRFSSFQKARSFVAPAARADFLARMKALGDARFTDFDSEEVELDEDKQGATVRVTYSVYTPSMPYEVEVEETQVWRRDGLSNKWEVVSSFDGLAKLAVN